MDSVGEGEGGKIWENGIETCIISYKKLIMHWDDPEEWYGEGGGRGFRMGKYTCGGVMLMYGKNQYNIVK